MIAAEIIDAMIAAGASAEVVAAAWKADLAKDEAKKEEKRAKDASRQRRHRESRNVTVTGCDDALPPAPSPEVSPQTPLPTPTHTPEDPTPRARKGSFPCPDGVDPQHWQDFLSNRKTKRLTNTPTAYRQQIKALDELADDEWPPGRIVEFAAARGWGAIHDPRTSFNGQPNSQQRRAEHGTDSLTAIALQRLSTGPPS